MKQLIHKQAVWSLIFLMTITPAFVSNIIHAAEMMDSEEEVRGEHNGRLLEADNLVIELAIFEDGVEPEFRAWAYSDRELIDPSAWDIEVILTRLGGEIDQFSFMDAGDYLRGQGIVEEPHSFDVNVSVTHRGQRYAWEYESHEGRVNLSPDMASANGVETTVAGPGTLGMSTLLYGKTLPDPQQVSHVTARFPGMIRSIGPALGDSVEAGETIASIEANNSLQSYSIQAPISGIVIEKHANPGEMAGIEPLMTIANYDNLWVDLTVFPGDARSIRPGLPVTINMDGLVSESTIRYLNPGQGNSPTVIARVPLSNPELLWSPGLLVEGYVEVEQIEVPLVVENRAIQTFRDWQVVFIKIGEEYEIRPLTLGRSDGVYTEVIEGLNPGDSYVVGNAYLLKADLEKDGATHDH
jgi:cobalt-zinc-cadmium efflux system membrane fusion protein